MGSGPIIGFVDLLATFPCPPELEKYSDNNSRCTVLFEAKTELESLGTLFRQVRMYQEGHIDRKDVSKMPFVIVCPDDSEAGLIRNQGLRFLKYEPNMKFNIGGV